jgi:hypothetical protein
MIIVLLWEFYEMCEINVICDVPDGLYRLDTRYKWRLPTSINECFSSSARDKFEMKIVPTVHKKVRFSPTGEMHSFRKSNLVRIIGITNWD